MVMSYPDMNDKIAEEQNCLFSFKTNQFNYPAIQFLSTGTRIRTQIKGFGDPYATVAPYPFVKKPLAAIVSAQQI